jgi:hypothetical protein
VPKAPACIAPGYETGEQPSGETESSDYNSASLDRIGAVRNLPPIAGFSRRERRPTVMISIALGGVGVYAYLSICISVLVDCGRMDELFRVVANHPLIVLAVAIILVLVLLKSFNQLN